MPDRQAFSPAGLLGANHPFVRVIDVRGALRRQSLATALAILIGIGGFASDEAWGLPLLSIAAVVQLVLSVAYALLAVLQQALAWDLIVEGSGDLPLPALARERLRLQCRRRRVGLARELEELVQVAERWPMTRPTLRPIFDPRQIRAEAAELRLIGARLHAGSIDVRGVARVERLLRLGDSPLYRLESGELQRELKSISAELTRTDTSARDLT